MDQVSSEQYYWVMARIHDEIRAMWRITASEYHVPVPPGVMFAEVVRGQERLAEAEGAVHLQPWLALFEQCNQWLVCLHITLDRRVQVGAVLVEDRAPIALIGSAAAYATGIRRLVRSGLDAPARALLRSFSESLYAALVMLHDASLRRTFKASEDEDEARKFWFAHLTSKRMDDRLRTIEIELGFDEDLQQAMKSFRRGVAAWLSQWVHPTWLAAELAAMPPTASDPEMHRYGTLGMSSAHSIATLDLAIKHVWYFVHVGYELVLRPYGKGFHHPDPADGIDTIVTVGQRVVAQLGQKYWSEIDRFLPERPAG